MYPTVGKIDFDSVNGRRIEVRVSCCDTCEEVVGVGTGLQVNFLFGHGVVRVGRAQCGTGSAPLGQVGQEERHAHQGIAAVVEFRKNDSAIAFAAKYRLARLHFSNDVDLAHSRCRIG